MCDFCRDLNNLLDLEKKLGHEVEYCPNCGANLCVAYALGMMGKAVREYLDRALLDGKETVEIDGEKLVVERPKITDFGDPKKPTNPQMPMAIDLDKVDISKEMEMLDNYYLKKTVESSYGYQYLCEKWEEFNGRN